MLSTDRALRAITLATRDLRKRHGMTRAELAARAGVSPAAIWRIETGGLERVPLGGVFDVLEELGAEFDLTIRPPFLADGGLQKDAAHARMSAYSCRRLERHGWLAAQEVRIGSGRSRGWIDVLAYHPVAEACLCAELKTALPDIGAIQRTMNWYEGDAWDAAHRLGWHPRRIVSALLVLDTEANHARLRENAEQMRRAFPTRAHELEAWLNDPANVEPPVGKGIALIDPLSRRRDWLRSGPSDGRRSPAPDENYAGFMERLRRRR